MLNLRLLWDLDKDHCFRYWSYRNVSDRAEEYKATYSCQAYTLEGRDNKHIDKLKVLIKDLDHDTLKEEGNRSG